MYSSLFSDLIWLNIKISRIKNSNFFTTILMFCPFYHCFSLLMNFYYDVDYFWSVPVKFKSARLVLCLVAQSRPTLCDPMDCITPGSSIYGDSPGNNTGVWVAMPSSGGSSQPRDQTQVSHIAGRFFSDCGTREAQARLKNALIRIWGWQFNIW